MAKRSTFAAFSCALLLSSSSWAATIEPGQGNLTINHGQGFQPVNSRIDGKVGDSVMVAPGGSATVVYDDGCKVTVQPGAVTTIVPLSPCASGSNAADMGVPGAPPPGPGYYPPPPPNDAWLGVAVGVAAAGAVGLAIYEATKKNGNTVGASP